MDKHDNVFIKLQIEKNQHSGCLMITINFDKDAPNFSIDKNIMSWSPTFEELDFVIETYKMISKGKRREERREDNRGDFAPLLPSENKTEDLSKESSEKKISTFEPLKGEFDIIRDAPDSYSEKKAAAEKEIFVQADDETIDEVLKKKSVGVGEALILDEEDKGVIDRMLKKRGKEKDKT